MHYGKKKKEKRTKAYGGGKEQVTVLVGRVLPVFPIYFNTGYVYRLNTTTNSFEETARSYADCGSGLSAGRWINNYANGLISKEPNWKSIKFNLNYCLDFYC